MSLIQKLKILMAVSKVLGGIGKMKKVKAVWDKLDGLKSVLGLLAVTAYYAAPSFGIELPQVVLDIGCGLAGVGLVHKVEKGTGILAKAFDILSKSLDVARKTEKKLKEKK